jgi:GntR family transcriptional regulator/MocR family aminotransferase
MDRSRTNSALLVVLQRSDPVPLHRQIATSIRDSIRAGRLPRGSSLPPSRVLAADLGVSRGVVVEAYQQLAAEGYLASQAGGYTQVAAGPAPAATALRLARPQPPRIDLSYGRADVSSFPRAAWLRAIRGALAAAPNDVFGYLAGSGVPQLRTAVADYLNRVRGTLAQPDNIVITTGYAQGIALPRSGCWLSRSSAGTKVLQMTCRLALRRAPAGVSGMSRMTTLCGNLHRAGLARRSARLRHRRRR